MKILLTGCMGFIGSNVTAHLLNAGYKVVGIDNRSNCSLYPTDRIKQNSGKNWKNFKYYDCDVRDLKSLNMIGIAEKPHMIVHLAALGSVPRSFAEPSLVIDNNERGFCNVLTFSSSVGVKRVVFASSSSVYGDDPTPTRSEGLEGDALSPYALTKKHNEELAKIWSRNSNLEYIGLRFFNVYGPGQLPNSPYSAVIPKFINESRIVINGDGSTTRDFTYVDDVSEAIELAIRCVDKNFIVNVGTGDGTTIKELAKIISKKHKEIVHAKERIADVKYSVADTWRAKSLLKFSAAYNIEEGLAKTISYYEGLRGIHNL